MNKDINYTLSALVPILQMNREKVVSIEAVEDWYTIDGHEYMKEVAEIEYESGYCQYADIGCDSNLTAICDVIAVINQVKPKSSRIERIVRDVYPKPGDICECYYPNGGYGNASQCYGTKEKDPCLCGGDKNKCDFYKDHFQAMSKE